MGGFGKRFCFSIERMLNNTKGLGLNKKETKGSERLTLSNECSLFLRA